MLQMGFSQEEIQDSLVNQKYNDVMAAYLLLDYRNSEVHISYRFILHSTKPLIIKDVLATVTLSLYNQFLNYQPHHLICKIM